jgi:hypothetical protein
VGIAHFDRTGMIFSDRLAVGCRFKQPTGVARDQSAGGLRKVSESTVNCALPYAALATLVSTIESMLFRVPPFPQCFRGGKPASPGIALASDAQVPRTTTTIGLATLELRWIMREGRGVAREQSGKWLNTGGIEVTEGM